MNGWRHPLESVRGAKTLLMYRSGKKYIREKVHGRSTAFNEVSFIDGTTTIGGRIARVT